MKNKTSFSKKSSYREIGEFWDKQDVIMSPKFKETKLFVDLIFVGLTGAEKENLKIKQLKQQLIK